MATTQPAVDSVILDGAAIVHIFKPNICSTFKEYSGEVFGSYISSQLKNATRCDIVWDVYQDGSLKTGTCEKRGISRKQRVEPGSKIPKDWGDFLKREENKEELFSFLAKESLKVQDKGQIMIPLEISCCQESF